MFDNPPAHSTIHGSSRSQESGFALLLTIFIITITSILIVEFADTVRSFQRSSRAVSDQVRGIFILKSAVNIGEMLLEAPKMPDKVGMDTLTDTWAMIGSAPSLPIEGFPGDLRLEIVDEDGKLDLNSLAATGGSTVTPPTPGTNPVVTPVNDTGTFYRNAFRDLFYLMGFLSEKYEPSEFRTLGNTGLEAPDQVATIIDWIDKDTEPFNAGGFEGQGTEGSGDKNWFFNRPFRSLSELALVPGMTLERVGQVARFVRVSQGAAGVGARTININTAPLEVLLATGIPQTVAEDIVGKRLTYPYPAEALNGIISLDPKLSGKLAVQSSEFMVLARVNLSTKTLWARAYFAVQHTGLTSRATLRLLEFY